MLLSSGFKQNLQVKNHSWHTPSINKVKLNTNKQENYPWLINLLLIVNYDSWKWKGNFEPQWLSQKLDWSEFFSQFGTRQLWFSGPFHTTSEKFENWVSIWKLTMCFPSTLRLHNNHRSMEVMIEENSGREWSSSWCQRFRKASA